MNYIQNYTIQEKTLCIKDLITVFYRTVPVSTQEALTKFESELKKGVHHLTLKAAVRRFEQNTFRFEGVSRTIDLENLFYRTLYNNMLYWYDNNRKDVPHIPPQIAEPLILAFVTQLSHPLLCGLFCETDFRELSNLSGEYSHHFRTVGLLRATTTLKNNTLNAEHCERLTCTVIQQTQQQLVQHTAKLLP